VKVPILVIAYNRGDNLRDLLLDLESLPARAIHISVDGSRDGEVLDNPVYKVAQEFQFSSHHSVTTQIMPENLGLLQHFKVALSSFFNQNEFGIILEDDMEFSPSFIEYVDLFGEKLLSQNVWSICGHNPIDVSVDNNGESKESVSFFYTHTHTIWGWATSARVIGQFLEFLASSQLRRLALEAIRTQAPLMAINPFLKKSFARTWNFKLSRNLSSLSPNWDNLWVIAAWHFKKPSIMSTRCLVVEGRNQNIGQTHIHTKKMVSLARFKVEEKHGQPDPIKIFREQKMIEVWGIKSSNHLRLIAIKWKSFFNEF